MSAHAARMVLSLGLVLSLTLTASAQPPTLNAPFPMGAQRGTTLDLNLTGANLADPVNVLMTFPARATIPTENNNGKEAAKLLVRLEIPKDAPLGWHTLRVATRRGVSNFRLFCIDDLPQVLEADTNRMAATAQPLPIPCVACGRIDPEVTDHYKFTVQAGQRLSFEVLGRRLGSGLDPQITITNAKTGRQVAFSDDAPAQNKDPRLTYTFKEAGEYLLELRDVRYMGGNDWYYRLRVGDFPCATTPVPLAARRGQTVQVSFAGPNVEGVSPVKAVVPASPLATVMDIWPASAPVFPTFPSGLAGWTVPLTVSDLDETLETEPNDDPAKANRAAIPSGVSARFQKKGDRDHYVFAAKKGQRVLIEGHTQEHQSPTSLYLVLKDAKGAQVGVSNPANEPARIDFTPPADGDYTLMAEHLHYWGGPEESYRLTFLPQEPGFTLTATADRVDVPQGGVGVLTVQATRRDYNGPIEVSVASPAEVSGTVTILEGKTAALLGLTVPESQPLAGRPLVLTGKATINGKPVVQRLQVPALVSQALGNLTFPPQQLAADLAVGIAEKPPFHLAVKFDHADAVAGLTAPVTITAAKAPGFDEEIAVTLVGLPPPQGQQPVIPVVNGKIPKGQTEVKLELKPAAKSPLGAQPLAFSGKAKAGGVEHTVFARPSALNLSLPFELQVDAGAGKLAAPGIDLKRAVNGLAALDALGGPLRLVAAGALDLSAVPPGSARHVVKVKAIRKGGYQGPITLEVQNLPPGVTAEKATIAEKQTEVQIELRVSAAASPAEKKDVTVLGTATGAGNQQNGSASFAVAVVKP